MELTEEAMLKAAREFDSGVKVDGGGDDGQAIEPSKPTTDVSGDSGDTTANDSSEAGGKDESQGSNDNDGKEAGQQKEPEAKEGDKPKDKSKFAKEMERREKTWREINAEKERLKAEKEAIQREREEWSKQREATSPSSEDDFRDSRGHTAKEYDQAAEEYEKAGEDAHAKVARRMAEEARGLARKAKADGERAKFEKAWSDNFHKLTEKHDWLKDAKSEKYNRAVDLLNRYKVLQQTPDGINHAVELVELQDRAASSDKLSAEIKSLKSELETLRKKTSIGGGKPTAQKGPETPFEKLSLKEQEAQLKKLAHEFDANAA